MSGSGAPNLSVDANDIRVALIAGSWHDDIVSWLVRGAKETLETAGAKHELFRVAGAFELPLAAQAALTPKALGGGSFDAAVCLGVIVRGGTPHFEYVSAAVTEGLTRVQLDTGHPVGFGVLTTDTEQQALERSGCPGAPESKGREAVEAVLHVAATVRAIATGR